MVVPIAAAAARVGASAVRAGSTAASSGAKKIAQGNGGGGVRNARLLSAANDNGGYARAARTVQKVQHDRRTQEEEGYANDDRKNRVRSPRTRMPASARVPNISSSATKIARIAKAARVSWTIGGIVMPFYIVHLLFSLMIILGAAAEYAGESFFWGLGSYFIPGKEIFAFGFIGTFVIGWIFMSIALILYTFQGVAWLRSGGIFTFMACLIGYCVPVASLVPWVLVWLFLVVRAQK